MTKQRIKNVLLIVVLLGGFMASGVLETYMQTIDSITRAAYNK